MLKNVSILQILILQHLEAMNFNIVSKKFQAKQNEEILMDNKLLNEKET
jgi:hypothetical protein